MKGIYKHMVVNIVSGPKHVGKTTFVEKKSGFKIFEDEVIASMTAGDYKPTDEQVFVAKMRLVEEAINAGHKKIWVVGKHLSRNERIKMYKHIKDIDKAQFVNVIILHQPAQMLYRKLLETSYNPGSDNVFERLNYYFGNENVITDSINDMKTIKSEYMQYTPPREEVDCDTFNIIAPAFRYYKQEFEKGIDESHNSPYHQETIREHINMTIDMANQYPEYPELPEIAAYHDLGKVVCRSRQTKKTLANMFFADYNGNQFDCFHNHENVSAMYYLIKNKNNLTSKVLDNAEIIYQHMHAKDGFKSKYIRKHKLTPHIVEMATFFNENCDTKAKVVDTKILETYQLLQKLNNDPLIELVLANPNRFDIGVTDDNATFVIIDKSESENAFLAFNLDDLREN